ncbi:cell division protein FtsZ [Candidatus Shapirobacteria bacterium RBG_13_44_7]|uniref:Cell division protein FtsZ n=1 Tax=Candidatus Shapirobacteria bacterium RBG_13_44_7 TaxID=1802149 RepID=A0A1F7SEZ1_9BACT|nr:MAG: cell division protein FtsZ [Candidatus Shapirobacteria bacterium RBG_13_44_7]
MGLIKTLSGQFAKIKVIGIGGGGNNAINSMISDGDFQGVDFVAVNTDSQALLNSLAPIKIQIGEKLTKGLGAGGNPQIGEDAANESEGRIKEILEGTDMIFITGGMGGGTCTGAAPVIAKIAKDDLGILTVAVITKPFLFEGTRRMSNAIEGINRIKDHVDTLIVIPNQKVMEVINNQSTLQEAFKIADSVLQKGTKAIANLITTPGLINLDFADIRSIMSNAGTALMGVGEADGEGKAQKAIESAIDSPLVEANINGARGVLINVTGGPDITMAEIEEAAQIITKRVAPDANIIFGTNIDEGYKGKIKITVIATGFDNQPINYYHPKDSDATTTPPPIESVSSEDIEKFLGDQPIPTGVDISDEFDIPSFLRKNN